MQGRSRHWPRIAATVVWLLFWVAGIFVFLRVLGTAAFAGELVPAAFLVLWLAVAGLGLWRVFLRLGEQLTGERLRPPHQVARDGREWRDGMPPGQGQ